MGQNSNKTLVRGNLWRTRMTADGTVSLETVTDGAIVYSGDGRITHAGAFEASLSEGATVIDHRPSLLIAGLVDAHLHLPQLDTIGSHGEGLLQWLETYIFPEETRFSDAALADRVAQRLVRQLIAHGTTTAGVFGSSHWTTTEAYAKHAVQAGLKGFVGKVSMDRHGPAELLCSAEEELERLGEWIASWSHERELLFPALTPRFAPACSPKLLSGLGDLFRASSQAYVQTHWAETEDEISWVKSLFPNASSYLGVYHDAGLLGRKTFLGHGLYPESSEFEILRQTQAVVVHCPTSNSFLGSGLFPREQYAGLSLAMGSDIGAGTSLSMWRNMAEAYRLQRLRRQVISPCELLHWATTGAAQSMSLVETGELVAGKAADFQVVDWQSDDLLKARFERTVEDEDRLSALITLADDRHITHVYLNGREAKSIGLNRR